MKTQIDALVSVLLLPVQSVNHAIHPRDFVRVSGLRLQRPGHSRYMQILNVSTVNVFVTDHLISNDLFKFDILRPSLLSYNSDCPSLVYSDHLFNIFPKETSTFA